MTIVEKKEKEFSWRRVAILKRKKTKREEALQNFKKKEEKKVHFIRCVTSVITQIFLYHRY
jgi:hypothetical protein